MSIIRLTTCESIIEAGFLKHILENENIECFLTNENFTTLVPIYNGIMGAGIQLMIDEKDYERSSELIHKPTISNRILCPNCNSTNISFGFGSKKELKTLGVILSLVVLIPFGNIKRYYYCKDCKWEF
jgi:hypothetical protein